MRVDAPAIVFLAQTASESLDGLARAPWWAVMILALLGGTAGIAKAWSVVAEYLRDKRDAAKRAADEEKLRRDAKAKAEIEQIEALTLMARNVEPLFSRLAQDTREANELMRREIADNARAIAENTRATYAMVTAWNDEKRMLLSAIAQKLGVQTSVDETNLTRRSSPGQAQQERTA
jgi:hypothetical protein